jgi:hypothetical protein
VNSHKRLDKKWGDDGVPPIATGYKLMKTLLVKTVKK